MAPAPPKAQPGVDFSKTIGHTEPPQRVSWLQRDLLLYAASIGAGAEDLEYVYELNSGFRAFPTYPLVLPLKGDSQEFTRFDQMIAGRSATPGFPKLSPNTIVHGEQSLRILEPLPLTASGWELRKRISAVHDKGPALILETEVSLVNPSTNKVHAVAIGSAFYRGGGQGTGFSQSIADKPPSGKVPKDKAPDFSLKERTSPAQAVIYRLNSDYNPLHIDPEIGRKGGLGGVILHGLCSYGFATRAILKTLNPDDGKPGSPRSDLKVISARFSSPVKPGDELETKVWIVKKEQASDGSVKATLAFEQFTDRGNKTLSGGHAEVVVTPASKSSKL